MSFSWASRRARLGPILAAILAAVARTVRHITSGSRAWKGKPCAQREYA
jgi:hypothetical protein